MEKICVPSTVAAPIIISKNSSSSEPPVVSVAAALGVYNHNNRFLHCDPSAQKAQQELLEIQQSQQCKDMYCVAPPPLALEENEKITAEYNDDDQLFCIVCKDNLRNRKQFPIVDEWNQNKGKWGVITWHCCGPSCAKRYHCKNNGFTANRIYSIQTDMQLTVYGISDSVIASPDPVVLKCHGGHMSRAEYRSLLHNGHISVEVMGSWFYSQPMRVITTYIPQSNSAPSPFASSSSTIKPHQQQQPPQLLPTVHTVDTSLSSMTMLPSVPTPNALLSDSVASMSSRPVHTVTSTESIACKTNLSHFMESRVIEPMMTNVNQ